MEEEEEEVRDLLAGCVACKVVSGLSFAHLKPQILRFRDLRDSAKAANSLPHLLAARSAASKSGKHLADLAKSRKSRNRRICGLRCAKLSPLRCPRHLRGYKLGYRSGYKSVSGLISGVARP